MIPMLAPPVLLAFCSMPLTQAGPLGQSNQDQIADKIAKEMIGVINSDDFDRLGALIDDRMLWRGGDTGGDKKNFIDRLAKNRKTLIDYHFDIIKLVPIDSKRTIHLGGQGELRFTNPDSAVRLYLTEQFVNPPSPLTVWTYSMEIYVRNSKIIAVYYKCESESAP